MRTVEWHEGVVKMIDQRLLPTDLVINAYTDFRDVATAIRTMVIRGAPAIGAAAGFGMALAAVNSAARDRPALLRDLNAAADILRDARPTAVNLSWGIERMLLRAAD